MTIDLLETRRVSDKMAYEYYGDYGIKPLRGVLTSSEETAESLKSTLQFPEINGAGIVTLQVSLQTGVLKKVHKEKGHLLHKPYYRLENISGFITQNGGPNIQVFCSAVKLNRFAW